MGQFKKRRKESAAEWHARLTGVDVSGLSSLQLDELTLRRVQAERAIRRVRRSHSSNGAPNGNGLARCMEHARALSADDRRRLIRWLEGCNPA